MASESGAVLHGPRVTLRPWRDDDREPCAALNADPLVMRYFRCPLDTLQSDAMLLRMRVAMATHGFGWWALDVPLLGFAGFVGLSRVPFEAPFSALPDPAIEVGWRLRTDAWGQGYATEGAQLALVHAFDTLNRAEIVSFTAEGNLPSRRVMTRLGMRPDGGFEHPGLPQGHPLRPHVLYRLTQADWRQAGR